MSAPNRERGSGHWRGRWTRGNRKWGGLPSDASVSFLHLPLDVCHLRWRLLGSLIWPISIVFLQGVIISQLRREFRSMWSPLFCLYHHNNNNNNGVRELSDPRSFWGWHIRYSSSLSPLPFPPLTLSLARALSLPFTGATSRTGCMALITPIDARGDGFNCGAPAPATIPASSSLPSFKHHKPATAETLLVRCHNEQSSRVFAASVTSVLIYCERIGSLKRQRWSLDQHVPR